MAFRAEEKRRFRGCYFVREVWGEGFWGKEQTASGFRAQGLGFMVSVVSSGTMLVSPPSQAAL